MAQSDLPPADGAVLDEQGRFTFGWAKFFQSLWFKTGKGALVDGAAAYLKIENDGTIGCYRCATGVKLGKVTLT